MLTRHFLSHRTTANCCRLLLHIKVNISQVKFHISHEIKISPTILNFSLTISDSFWWNSPFLSSTLSWMVSKFILEWCVKFMFTWDVKSHSYGFTPWWPLHSIITNGYIFQQKGNYLFWKKVMFLTSALKYVLYFCMHLLMNMTAGYVLPWAYLHTHVVYTEFTCSKNLTQIFSTKIFAFMVIVMCASVFFSW